MKRAREIEPARTSGVLSDAEARFNALRAQRMPLAEIRDCLGLTQRRAEVLSQSYHQEHSARTSLDSSCPKFADHDRHVADVLAAGRFMTLAEALEARG